MKELTTHELDEFIADAMLADEPNHPAEDGRECVDRLIVNRKDCRGCRYQHICKEG